jgi:hypothetical protein
VNTILALLLALPTGWSYMGELIAGRGYTVYLYACKIEHVSRLRVVPAR